MRKSFLQSIMKKALCFGVLIIVGAILNKAEADKVIFRCALESEDLISDHETKCIITDGTLESPVKIGKSVLRIRDEIRKNIPHTDFAGCSIIHTCFMEYTTVVKPAAKYYLTPIGYECDKSKAKSLLGLKRKGLYDYMLAPIKVVLSNGKTIPCQIQLHNSFITGLDVPIAEKKLEPFEPVPRVEITEEPNGNLIVKQQICPIRPIPQSFCD